MGLFSSILGGNTTPTQLDPKQSFIGLLLAIVAADGHLAESEIDAVNAVANGSNILRGWSEKEFIKGVDLAADIIRRDGFDALVKLCAAGLPAEHRNGTFAVVCDLACSDGYMEPAEEQLLEKIQLALAITDDVAAKVVEVISWKNRV